ncbi:MAG TPA: hypothetical protein VK686_18260 [Bryobacteraceae bacterium]|nr:hypothetical protein [Bryobacteraceae bacterium]
MRSLALSVLLGSFVAASLCGQSLTEHAAAAAGATIGTAAGKPLGTSLGKMFGDVDKTTSTAAGAKTAKPIVVKSAVVAPPVAAEHTATVVIAPAGAGAGEGAADGGGKVASAHRLARHKELPVESQPVEAAPLAPIVISEPVFKEPNAQDLANVRVGASANEMRALLGVPESKVSIPDDDGHLLEICQYWAKGEQLGTIRLDNGRVVSVQVNN